MRTPHPGCGLHLPRVLHLGAPVALVAALLLSSAPRAHQGRWQNLRPWTPPSVSILLPCQPPTFLKEMDVAGLCRLLPWKSYTGVRPGPASGRPSSAAPPRISEYDCDLIWDRSSDAAVSGPLDEHIVTVIKSVLSHMGMSGSACSSGSFVGDALWVVSPPVGRRQG